MLRLDLSPEFRARREPDPDPGPASEMIRAARTRARRLGRMRVAVGAFILAAAAPFLAFKAQMLGPALQGEPAPLVAKAPVSPPAAVAQLPKPADDRFGRAPVDFTATSATCSATAKEGEEGFCGPARRSAAAGLKDTKKSRNVRDSKSGKSAKSSKSQKRDADLENRKQKKAAAGGARG